jgi:hypothetical protein
MDGDELAGQRAGSDHAEAMQRLRSFKRYYRWAGDALRQLSAHGSLSLRASYRDGAFGSELAVPDEEAATRFAVVMRHFLSAVMRC